MLKNNPVKGVLGIRDLGKIYRGIKERYQEGERLCWRERRRKITRVDGQLGVKS